MFSVIAINLLTQWVNSDNFIPIKRGKCYEDFHNQLIHNKRRLSFKTKLFQATMQGNDVADSIISALNRIAKEIDEWDAVVIIRGGGATSDLQGFDSLELAENVAQFPLPVITGIGHERDDTIIDLIAHTRVKTPTAAAELLIHHQEEELDMLEDFAARLMEQTKQLLYYENDRLKLLAGKAPLLFAQVKAREDLKLHQLMATLSNNSLLKVEQAKGTVEHLYQSIRLHAPILIQRENTRILLNEGKIQGSDPSHILRLGFSITRVNGQAIKQATEVKAGDEIETILASGTLKSTITWTKK